MTNRQSIHYIGLVGAIALGAALRFWNLELKPVWMDEVITALYSLGRTYNDLPLEMVFPLNRLEQLFTEKSAVSCPQIAHTVATQSTHPPLFFCLMHSWVEAPLVGVMNHSWVWTVRSLPALFGVGAIAAVSQLNTRAFSPAAGLMAAAVMAVSPFAVYLSQEARHYTLPMLLITLALLGLIQIQQDLFYRQQLRFRVWLSWAIVNSIGFYVHYFFILAFIAQIGTLLALIFCCKAGILRANTRHGISPTTTNESFSSTSDYFQVSILPAKRIVRIWVAAIATTGVVLSFLPWLPVMLGHFNRSETSWIPSPNNIAPLYQTVIGWLLIVIALPVENQSLWIAIPAGLVMFLFGSWVAQHVFRGLKQLWYAPKTQLATFTLASFTLCVLLEFFAIAYLLGKDITVVPRYNFVYYPSLCALIGASLLRGEGGREAGGQRSRGAEAIKDTNSLPLPIPLSPHPPISPFAPYPQRGSRVPHPPISPSLTLLLVGLISCAFVVSNLVLQKPFQPERVAQNMNQEPTVPLMLVVGYRDYQDVALGLSFALALEKVRKESASEFAFFKQSPGFETVWQKLSALPPTAASKLNLWVVGPGIRRRDYLPQLALKSHNCTIDRTQHYRIGVPYQLYRCQ